MRTSSRHLPIAFFVLLLLLSACNDPTGVGENLVAGSEDQPRTQRLPADSFATVDLKGEVTGNSGRILVGAVDDPMLGTITAAAYMDFRISATQSQEFRTGPVTAAELHLRRDYFYGDTTATVTLRLLEATRSYNGAGLRVDSVLTSGTEVMQFNFSARDTLIKVPLPAAWVTLRADSLRSAAFDSKFYGFQFENIAGNVVVGFKPETTFLVVSGGDSTEYVVSNFHSTVLRTGEVNVPPGYLAIQDNVGPGIRTWFDFQLPAIQTVGINRFAISVQADPDLNNQNRPSPSFFRPTLKTLSLEATFVCPASGMSALGTACTPGGFGWEAGLVGFANVNGNNRFILSDRGLDTYVQAQTSGNATIQRITIRPYDNPNTTADELNTLNVTFIRTEAPVAPFAEILYTPVLQ